MFDNEFSLDDAFTSIPLERWREVVEKDLRGASFEKRLVRRTYEDVAVRPLYTSADAAPHPVPGIVPGWEIRQDHVHPDPSRVRADVADDLAHGVASVILRLDPTGQKGVLGVTADALEEALADADLAQVAVAVEAGPHYAAVADAMTEVWRRRGVDATDVRGSFLADPLGALMNKGRLPVDLETLLTELGELAVRCDTELPGMSTAKVSTCPVHNAGAGADQELGVALACGLAYLRAMTDAGLSLDAAVRQVQVCFSTGGTFFADAAKLRAARLLWTRLLDAAGVPDAPMKLHARTSIRMLTRRDPWVNILRATAGAFAAAVGGADIVTVTPHDHLLGPPGRTARRIARNVPILLEEESHLTTVADPAAGSWFVESLTREFCERGWAFFREIETRGGIASVLADGWLRERVDAVHEARARDVAKRRVPITGVSEFPHLAETPITMERPDRAALRDRWGAPGLLARKGDPITVDAFPERRTAESFEALRDRSDARLAATGTRPRAFLANLGPVAVHTARAAWSRNLLEAGGIEALDNKGFAEPAEAAAAFADSGAGLAVICSSDDVYAEKVCDTAVALKDAGAVTVMVAGRPGESEAAWREAGVDLFIHVGCDVHGTLRDLLHREGVEA